MIVLDASALLCYAKQETGYLTIADRLPEAHISAINWSEVVQKALYYGLDITKLRFALLGIGLTIHDYTVADAEQTAQLWQVGKPYGLSLADRACLALGIRLGYPIVTKDVTWTKVGLPLIIQVLG